MEKLVRLLLVSLVLALKMLRLENILVWILVI
jgi:hypothetical protein